MITGVHFHSRAKKWVAGITTSKGRIHLGYFDNSDDAGVARRRAEDLYGVCKQYGDGHIFCAKDWRYLFTYCPSRGELVNRVSRLNGALKGLPAANLCRNSGYRFVTLKGKHYREHRIIWEMHFGKIAEKMMIDHINRVRSDNRMVNLRLVTNQENNLNLSPRKNESCGHTGVTWSKKDKRWQAQIGFKRKRIYLGQFIELDDAINARMDAEAKYNFTPNRSANQ